MTDLLPAAVPELSDIWLDSHRAALLENLPSRQRRWKALTVVGTAATATAVASVVIVGGGAQSAFAGWSAAPTVPSPGQIQDSQATCQGRLDQVGPSPKGPSTGVFQPVLSDVRGPFTTMLFSDANGDTAVCLSNGAGSISLRSGVSQTDTLPPTAAAVEQVSFAARDGQGYTLAHGRVGSSVSGMALTLDDGSAVDMTIGNGYFLGWWPGTEGITSAKVTSPSGATVEQLDLPGPPSPPASGTK